MPGLHFNGKAGGKKLGGASSPKLGSKKGLVGVQAKTPIGRKMTR